MGSRVMGSLVMGSRAMRNLVQASRSGVPAPTSAADSRSAGRFGSGGGID